MRALVLSGTNNVYSCLTDDGVILDCRFKGKILKGQEDSYNPLAPGDWVSVERDESGSSLITVLEKRKNAFCRWNQKGKSSQILAANIDLVLCVTTPTFPPFRPRFLDRLLLQADIAGIEAVVVLNKKDLDSGDPDLAERIEDYRKIGYRVLEISAKLGNGIDELRVLIAGKKAALVGQSGVGKSSILNALDSALSLRTAAVSQKFERGTHTTTMGRLLRIGPESDDTWIVDTPGIRCFIPDGVSASDVASHLREFAPLVGTCTFGMSCAHEREPGCKILEAVEAGIIHEDRYESFLGIRFDLAQKGPSWER